jgi:hypothetical protein
MLVFTAVHERLRHLFARDRTPWGVLGVLWLKFEGPILQRSPSKVIWTETCTKLRQTLYANAKKNQTCVWCGGLGAVP